MRSKSRRPRLTLVVVTLLILLGVTAPLLSAQDPERPSLSERLEHPAWSPWATHPLGTDGLGRDMLARLAYGARVTLIVALLAVVLGTLVGGAIGLIAGYSKNRVDDTLMRVVDAALAFPSILIALLLALTLGAGIRTVIIAVGAVIWARFARVMRGEVLRIRETDFVVLARTHGCSTVRILIRHIFPNTLNTLVVLMTLELANVVLLEASLSFLGAGVPPPTPSWGSMIGDGRSFISIAWWISVIPGVAIMVTVLAVNRVGDWLRDLLDPELRSLR